MGAPVEIKEGAAADACRYRFKEIDDPHGLVKRGGRYTFAVCVAAYCADILGSSDMPLVRWFRRARADEKAMYGTDEVALNGFAVSTGACIWINSELRDAGIVGTVAHETCHAIKHRGREPSIECEREADAFKARITAEWNIFDDSPYMWLFVVDPDERLPGRALPNSVALRGGVLYRASHRGTVHSPRWFAERRIVNGIMTAVD